jgi:hypothetical protein
MQLPSLAPPSNAIVPGGENPHFTPSDRPLVVRGFMPDVAGLRGIAIGTPEKIHFAFDSERCELTAVWSGDFVEVGGWYDNGRGTVDDNAVKPLGKILWRGPENSSWHVKGHDAASLTPQFRAVSISINDVILNYSLQVGDGKPIDVEERLTPTKTGFMRRVTRSQPSAAPVLVFNTGPNETASNAIDLQPGSANKTVLSYDLLGRVAK